MVIGYGDIAYKVHAAVCRHYDNELYDFVVYITVVLKDIIDGEIYYYEYRVNDGHMLGYVNRLFDRVAGIADLDGMKALRRRLVHDRRKCEKRRRRREITGVDV